MLAILPECLHTLDHETIFLLVQDEANMQRILNDDGSVSTHKVELLRNGLLPLAGRTRAMGMFSSSDQLHMGDSYRRERHHDFGSFAPSHHSSFSNHEEMFHRSHMHAPQQDMIREVYLQQSPQPRRAGGGFSDAPPSSWSSEAMLAPALMPAPALRDFHSTAADGRPVIGMYSFRGAEFCSILS